MCCSFHPLVYLLFLSSTTYLPHTLPAGGNTPLLRCARLQRCSLAKEAADFPYTCPSLKWKLACEDYTPFPRSKGKENNTKHLSFRLQGSKPCSNTGGNTQFSNKTSYPLLIFNQDLSSSLYLTQQYYKVISFSPHRQSLSEVCTTVPLSHRKELKGTHAPEP